MEHFVINLLSQSSWKKKKKETWINLKPTCILYWTSLTLQLGTCVASSWLETRTAVISFMYTWHNSFLICVYILLMVVVVGEKILGEDLMNHSLPIFKFYFSCNGDQLSQIPLFRPGSVHRGQVNWDDCSWVLPDEMCLLISLIGLHTKSWQHRQSIPTLLYKWLQRELLVFWAQSTTRDYIRAENKF